jgi:purine-cytosine permease-like protein
LFQIIWRQVILREVFRPRDLSANRFKFVDVLLVLGQLEFLVSWYWILRIAREFTAELLYRNVLLMGFHFQYFTLDFPTSMAVIACGTALGCTVSATTAVMGPRFGLRTMALSRFAGGFIGTGIFSVLNALTQIAYAVTAAIVAAQALRAINHGLTLTVGIVVSTVITLVVCVGGYKILHYWERYAWIACFIIYCIILGLGSRGNYDVHAKTATMDTGKPLIGDVLSFFGIMFSVGSGWTSIAAGESLSGQEMQYLHPC